MMGPYANVAVFLTVAFTIVCVLLACGNLASKYVQPYFFDPEVIRNRRLCRINAHLKDVSERLDDQAKENKELREFFEYAKKEVGKLNWSPSKPEM